MKCGKCGFPNKPDASICVNCGAKLDQRDNPFEISFDRPNDNFYQCKSCSYTIQSSVLVCPSCGFDHGNATGKNTISISDFTQNFKPVSSTVKLVPVNFKADPIDLSDGVRSIGRDLFPDEDPSVSLKDHIKVEVRDGELYLENTSTNGATFVQVTEKIKVPDEAYILIGQSKIFKVEIS